MLDLSMDLHVHSTFSDGKNTLEENAAAAAAAGIRTLGCVDHVRADSPWVPEFVAAVQEVQTRTDVRLVPGVETKMLDTNGRIDAPDLSGLALEIVLADHQLPTRDGPLPPRTVRDLLATDAFLPSMVGNLLVTGYCAAMKRHGPVLVAHPFSFLPKVGLDESAIPVMSLRRFARTVVETRSVVEVSERWRCPSPRTYATLAKLGVRFCASTDSHRARTIGQYDYVERMARVA